MRKWAGQYIHYLLSRLLIGYWVRLFNCLCEREPERCELCGSEGKGREVPAACTKDGLAGG